MKRVILGVLCLLFASSVFAKDVFILEVKGIITGYTYKYLKSNFEKITDKDALIVIKLDTPGGVLESTRQIVQLFLESKLPVVVYVSPQGARATSAGAFIALASNYLVMADGTHIGAAHPVNITGDDIKGDMRKKVENDTTAFIRSISQKRGKDEKVAMEMVLNSLSLTAKEAFEKRIADDIANTDQEFKEKLKKRFGISEITSFKINEPTIIERIAFFLSDPNVIVMLLLIAIAAIFLEFKMPGSFIFASIGIAAIILFLLAINIIPINYLGLLLIFAGIAFLIAEIFITSFGLLSLAGIVSLAFGMYILFSKGGNMGIEVSLSMIVGLIFALLVVVLFIGRLLIRDMKKKVVTGVEGMLGQVGEVIDWDMERSKGKVLVHGEIWSAVSDQMLTKGDNVQVTAVNDFVLRVRKIEV
ncbi:MAG: nodulation protein NfeD [Calditerrivibrio sp.]|nr:nodulation protein NfeD [Calditerrivibrio sp.]